MQALTQFTVKSWNVNTKDTQIIHYVLTGTERNGTDILCLQEFSWVANPAYNYLNMVHIGNNLYHVFRNAIIVGVFSYNMGMSSPSKHIARTSKYETHGTLVVWNPAAFTFVGTTVPNYHNLVQNELGHRSTHMITLVTPNMKFVNVVSIHGHATNSNKKDALFGSIFAQISTCNIPTFIAGDFNYNPQELGGLVPGNLVCNSVNGITHINPTTGQTFCIDHVVHNQLATVNNLLVSGIDQQAQSMKSLVGGNGHDHGILSFQMTI
jgi:exonuclease III